MYFMKKKVKTQDIIKELNIKINDLPRYEPVNKIKIKKKDNKFIISF